MDGPRDFHTKTEREIQIPYAIIYTWNLKYDTNESIYETDQETQRTDVQLPRQGSGRGRGEGQIGSLGLADASWYI